jgi:NAD(P)-dependent dehydrogenase (short-subunit alcohol dehydrogenase family)
MDRYADKNVLVIGGTSGIGLATARMLLAQGARVVITGRSTESIAAARTELGPEAIVVVADVANSVDVDELVARVGESLGCLDLLFVNAGVTDFAGFDAVTEQAYDHQFDVNAKGAYFLVQKLAPVVSDGGAVVMTTSVAGVRGLAGSSVYAASKAAVRSMVRSFARELLPRGIRVNAVSPGPIDTGILERALPAAAARQTRTQMEHNNPMQRFGRPQEVAAAVGFLGFEATFTTGAELPVDGGVTQL